MRIGKSGFRNSCASMARNSSLRRSSSLMAALACTSAVVRSVAGCLPDGVTLVDAPVRGSVPEATAGRLAIYVGASATDYERVATILSPLGTVHHVGGPGAGAATN